MAQTGYTPILIYSSSTATNAPAVGNLTNSTLGSELAINITDGKLFYKDNANAIQVIGWKTTPTSAGGTGLTSYTAGDLLYYATGTTLSKLAIGASGRWLGSSGTAPQWNAPAALTKTDDTNVTLTLGGSASTALLNAASLTLGWTGTLATSRGGTGLTTYADGGVLYASGTTTISTSSAFIYNATGLGIGVSPAFKLDIGGIDGTNMALRSTGTTSATFRGYVNGAEAGTMRFLNGGGIYFEAAGTEAMRIFASRGVSIGNTTDPGATNLSVSGNILSGTTSSSGSLSNTKSIIGGVFQTLTGTTASLANGATEDISNLTSGAAYLVTCRGSANTTTFVIHTVYVNGAGGITLATLSNGNGFVLTSPSNNTLRVTGLVTTQTYPYTLTRIF